MDFACGSVRTCTVMKSEESESGWSGWSSADLSDNQNSKLSGAER